MSFKLKSKAELFGYNEELSKFGRPVFEKKMGENIIGEANNDGTTFVDPDLSSAKKREVVEHEEEHHKQMMQGRLHYDGKTATWKEDTKSPPRVYLRIKGCLVDTATGKVTKEGMPNPFEDEAYAKEA